MLDKLFNFKGKVVLITGCSGQIGIAISKLFLSLDAKVYGMDINKSSIKNKRFFFIENNITNDDKTNSEIEKIFKKEKKIDILINNAGTSTYSNFEKRKNSELQKVYELNLRSVINITKFYLKFFRKNKLKIGNIINVGSIYGFISPDFEAYSKGERISAEIYSATKASVINITKYFAVYLAKDKIRVNCLSPGGVLNKKIQTNRFIKKYSNRVPLKRMAKTEDLLTAVLYLSSDQSRYTTGQNIVVDGGLSLK